MTRGFDDPLRNARRAVRTGRFRQALDALDTARAEVGVTPEWYLLMAMATWRVGEFGRSHGLAEEARAGYQSRGDTDGEMRAQNVAAAGAFARGHLAEAAQGFQRARALARRRKDTLMIARCTNNLGNVALHRGDTVEALLLYGHAVSLFEQVQSLRGITEAWYNTSIGWRDAGDLPAARRAADRALDAAERLGDPRLLGQTLVGRGETNALLGDLRLGGAQVQRGLQLALEQEDRLTECDALRVQSLVARISSDLAAAVELARRAVGIASEVENQSMIARTQEELARALIDLGEMDGARAATAAAGAALRVLGAVERAAAVEALTAA